MHLVRLLALLGLGLAIAEPAQAQQGLTTATVPAARSAASATPLLASALPDTAAVLQGMQAGPWTLSRLLQSALDSHPLILGKRSAQEAARADREGAEWARYPTPSVETYSRNVVGSRGVLRLEQPLYTGGRITANIDAATKREDAAAAGVEETGLDLRLRVIAGLVEALRQQARLQRAQEGVQQHRKLLDMIKRRVAQEVSSSVDQSLAESRLFQAINDESQVAQALNNALVQLSQLAGRPVTAVSGQDSNVGVEPGSRAQALLMASDYSPVLRRLTHEEAAAAADIEARRAAYLPSVALRLEHAMGLIGENRAFFVLQAQPGAGLSARSGVEAAIARRDAARQARQASVRDIEERVGVDWNELQAARERLANAQEAQRMSGEVFASYTRQYVIGRKSWLDVLNAVREATQADFAVEDARAQALGASLRLRAECGNLRLP